jgi:hypothetical protein
MHSSWHCWTTKVRLCDHYGHFKGNSRDTHQPSTPQFPLQANGFSPTWLKKHVSARGRLANNLPHKEQGYLVLWDVELIAAVDGMGVNVVIGAVVGVDCKSEGVVPLGWYWTGL